MGGTSRGKVLLPSSSTRCFDDASIPTCAASQSRGYQVMLFRTAVLKVLIAVWLFATPNQLALAADITFGTDLATSRWSIVSFPFKRSITTTIVNTTTLEVVADRAAGMLWHALPQIPAMAGKAEWSWRAEEGVGPTDLTRKGADDRLMAIYFVFGQPSDKDKDVMSVLNSTSVSALVYVFGGSGTKGTVLPSPHMGARGKFIILQPATAERRRWLDEQVDLEADFQRAFGRAPPSLLGIAISSDSDDTGGTNKVRVRGIRIGP